MKHSASICLVVVVLCGCTATETRHAADRIAGSIGRAVDNSVHAVATGVGTVTRTVGEVVNIRREDQTEERSDNLHDLCVMWARDGSGRFCTMDECRDVLPVATDRAMCPARYDIDGKLIEQRRDAAQPGSSSQYPGRGPAVGGNDATAGQTREGSGDTRRRLDDGFLVREGIRLHAYEDSQGRRHVGVGHRMLKGDPVALTREGVIDQLQIDFDMAEQDALHFCGDAVWRTMDDVRRGVILEMAFAMPRAKMSRFTRMRAALVESDWRIAADELLDSKWGRDDPKRVGYLAIRLRSGRV